MSRGKLTPFRGSQVREMLIAVLRAAAPSMFSRKRLRILVSELLYDEQVWAELARLASPPLPKPSRPATMESPAPLPNRQGEH